MFAIEELRYAILICRTSSINKTAPEDIVKGIEHKIELVKYKFYNLKLMVQEILPRGFSSAIQRNKTRSVNLQKKFIVGEMTTTTLLHI